MANNLPVFSRRRRRELVAKQVEDQAFQKAIQATATTLLKAGASMPMSSWYNAGGVGAGSALLARVTQDLAASFGRTPDDVELALAEQGLSWGPPFPPGRPLDPFWGYKRPARTWDYTIGENVQVTPRWDRISFPTLKAIIEAYDVAQICVRHLINDVRSLDFQFVPPVNVAEDATEDVEQAERFFMSPDKQQPFRAWLAEWLQDVLRYDAGCLFVRENEAGDPIALEVTDGSTIIPFVDFYGRVARDEEDAHAEPGGIWPGTTVPAYGQIIQGMPYNWFTADQIIYQPWNPLPESQYGLAPMEAVLLTANTDIRFQWFFLQYFTDGSVPQGFMEAPPDLSDPAQVQEWQSTWDALMMGDQAKLRQIRWVPAGAHYTQLKDNAWDKEFPLYLMRRVCASFGVTPNDLGFTQDINRSCYSEDTEVLTESGWKHYWEVGRTERIATYNPATRAMEYFVPDELHVYPYKGEMVHFQSRQVDALVTPDHRMWVRGRSEEKEFNEAVILTGVREARLARMGENRNKSGWSVSAVCRRLGISRTTWRMAEEGGRLRPETADKIVGLLPEVVVTASQPDWPQWQMVEAQELEGGRRTFWLADHTVWEGGEEIDSFFLPAVESQSHKRPERRIGMDLWLEFLGYVVSEGCIYRPNPDKANQQNRYVVQLSQSEKVNPEKAAAIGRCVGQLPFAFQSHVTSDGTRRWQVSDKALWIWLSANVGHLSHEKRLPGSFRHLAKRQLSILFEALMLGDGTTDSRDGCTGRTYYSKSKQLADDVHEVALRLGYRAQVAEPSRAGTDVCWRVLVSEPHDYELASHRNISRVPYEGNVWCFHVRPHHLFFTRRNGRVSILANTGDTQIDVQFRVGTLPLIRHVEDVLNLFIRERLKLKARIQFDTGREVEDRLASAQAEQIYWEIGALSSDEIRMKLGKRISRERPTPRIFNNPRSGPIPILAVDSLAGKIDPTTYGPAKGQKPVTDPYVGAPGALAVSGSPDAKAATSATAALQAKMRGAPQPALPAAPDDTADAAKALEEAFGVIDVLLDQLAAKSEREEEFDHNDWDAEFGPDNTGGPGVHPEGEEEDAEKDATAGVSAETGIQGNPLAGTEDDDDEAVAKAVRRWRDNSRNRVRQNLPPKRFVDPRLPEQVADAIWRHLEKAHTRSQVDAVFGNWLGQDPADAVQKRALELLRPDIDRLMESAQRVDAAREALAGVE